MARRDALMRRAAPRTRSSLLFSAEASHLALNPVFQLKALLFAAGLIIVAIYEFWARRTVEHTAAGAAMPARAKVTGVLSPSKYIWVTNLFCSPETWK